MTDRELLCQIKGFLIAIDYNGLSSEQVAVLLEMLATKTDDPSVWPSSPDYPIYPSTPSTPSNPVNPVDPIFGPSVWFEDITLSSDPTHYLYGE